MGLKIMSISQIGDLLVVFSKEDAMLYMLTELVSQLIISQAQESSATLLDLSQTPSRKVDST